MASQLLFVLAMMSVAQHCTANFDRERELVYYFISSQRYAPPDTQNETRQVRGDMDCIFACTAEHWCLSTNIKTTPKSTGLYDCELISSHRFATSLHLTPDVSFNHYSIKVIILFYCDIVLNIFSKTL